MLLAIFRKMITKNASKKFSTANQYETNEELKD